MNESHGSGWIKIYRCIQSNSMWQERPFDRARAWVDLILIANHKDGYIRVRGNKVTVLRGQIGYSILSLAERWGWSRGKVGRFLDELEDTQQIEQRKTRLTTLITIVNYDKYQAHDTTECATDGQQTDTNKNVKNVKKDNTPPISPLGTDLPEWLPKSEWADFIQMRKEIKKPLTSPAIKKAVEKLDSLRKQGHSPAEVLNQSVVHGWQGLFPLKDTPPQSVDDTRPSGKLRVVL